MIEAVGIIKGFVTTPDPARDTLEVDVKIQVPYYLLDGWNELVNAKGSRITLSRAEQDEVVSPSHEEPAKENSAMGSW